jgi:cytochrome P450
LNTPNHHSEYLARAVAALTPEGRERVDELLDQLAVAGPGREWIVRFATAREAEADLGRIDVLGDEEETRERLSKDELDVLTAGFMRIRDQEPLDDVADWANAVLALLADERR